MAITIAVIAVWPGAAQSVRIKAGCTAEQASNLSLPCTAEDPCPLYLELSAVTEAGPRLVLTGNIHTGAATVESILLISDDAGKSWTEAHARMPATVLDQIQFHDFETGWISGHSLSGRVPRDAFFLLTTDGGRTWRRRPVFGEARTGVIEHFWFTSRTHGTLAIDRVRSAENGMRYELWESLTGGESWNVRQVDSKPVPFKPGTAPVTVRLQVDRKVHKLQRMEGDKWTTFATVDLPAGECKPVHPEATEESTATK